VPSLFDPERRHLRAALIFLRHFVVEIKKSFKRDDRIHIEYVPTQVVTEWFRTKFEPGTGGPLDGILYGSARRPGGANLVLFIDNDGAVDAGKATPDALLGLVRWEVQEAA
jgi:RES domain